jgi:hypothetical protein
MSRSAAVFLFFFAGLAAGEAVHWFVGGSYLDHARLRNFLVVLQLLIGVVSMLWLGNKLRSVAGAPYAEG